MFQQLKAAGPRDLLQEYTKTAVNRTGSTLTKGDLVALDVTGSDGDVNSYTAYYQVASGSRVDTTHPFANAIAITATHLNGWGAFMVALETIANDALGKFGVCGVFDVLIAPGDGTNPAIASGGLGRPTASQEYLSAGSDGNVNIAQLLADGPTAAAAAVAKCLFNGLMQLNTHGG